MKGKREMRGKVKGKREEKEKKLKPIFVRKRWVYPFGGPPRRGNFGFGTHLLRIMGINIFTARFYKKMRKLGITRIIMNR